MKKSKEEVKSRILHLKNLRGPEKATDSSELTRSLFSETWRKYLDNTRKVVSER